MQKISILLNKRGDMPNKKFLKIEYKNYGNFGRNGSLGISAPWDPCAKGDKRSNDKNEFTLNNINLKKAF